MNRNDDIESLLSPWMSRQGRRAPDDLLLRVMWEVETMSQESMAIRVGILRSSLVGWVVGGLAVITMAVATGLLIANLRAGPAGAPGSPSPTAAPTWATWTVRETDAVGDVTVPDMGAPDIPGIGGLPGNAPDIVAVGISRVSWDNLFRLEIELTERMAEGTELQVWLETNGAGPYHGNGPLPMEGGPESCNGWFMEEAVGIRPDGSVQTYAGGKWMPSPRLSRPFPWTQPMVSVDIPVQEIGVLDKLAFQVVTLGDDGTHDWFPDEGDGCYPLIWESSPSSAPSSP